MAVSLAGWEVFGISICAYTQNQHIVSAVCVCNIVLFVLEDISLKTLTTSPPNTDVFQLLEVFSLHCWSNINNGQKMQENKRFS